MSIFPSGAPNRLDPEKARVLLRQILQNGTVYFSEHARQEMKNDNITEEEALLVLRGGVVEPAELVRGSWRYRVRTARAYVVTTFRAIDAAVIVTAWRRRR